MKTDDFCLSDISPRRICKDGVLYLEKDVKEFVRILKEKEIDLRIYGLSYKQGAIAWKVMNDFIDKLAGEKLTK